MARLDDTLRFCGITVSCDPPGIHLNNRIPKVNQNTIITVRYLTFTERYSLSNQKLRCVRSRRPGVDLVVDEIDTRMLV